MNSKIYSIALVKKANGGWRMELQWLHGREDKLTCGFVIDEFQVSNPPFIPPSLNCHTGSDVVL